MNVNVSFHLSLALAAIVQIILLSVPHDVETCQTKHQENVLAADIVVDKIRSSTSSYSSVLSIICGGGGGGGCG